MRLTRCLLSNYFKRYVDRTLNSKRAEPRWHRMAGWIMPKPRKWAYNEHRPWTQEFKEYNFVKERLGKLRIPEPVIPLKEWDMFKGDVVEILVGKDKGKRGVINCIIKERNWVFVDGLNCKYEMKQVQPGLVPMCNRKEQPLLVPNQVKLVDPSDEKGTDVDWRFTEEGERVRVSRRTGVIIPLPMDAAMLDDFVTPQAFVETRKDTKEKVLTKVTFEPKLKTFEEDIMESMGIKENRKPAKTYWY